MPWQAANLRASQRLRLMIFLSWTVTQICTLSCSQPSHAATCPKSETYVLTHLFPGQTLNAAQILRLCQLQDTCSPALMCPSCDSVPDPDNYHSVSEPQSLSQLQFSWLFVPYTLFSECPNVPEFLGLAPSENCALHSKLVLGALITTCTSNSVHAVC